MLALDSFLSVTDSVKRALAMTEKAVRELGYEVVPFEMTKSDWEWIRYCYGVLVANGAIM